MCMCRPEDVQVAPKVPQKPVTSGPLDQQPSDRKSSAERGMSGSDRTGHRVQRHPSSRKEFRQKDRAEQRSGDRGRSRQKQQGVSAVARRRGSREGAEPDADKNHDPDVPKLLRDRRAFPVPDLSASDAEVVSNSSSSSAPPPPLPPPAETPTPSSRFPEPEATPEVPSREVSSRQISDPTGSDAVGSSSRITTAELHQLVLKPSRFFKKFGVEFCILGITQLQEPSFDLVVEKDFEEKQVELSGTRNVEKMHQRLGNAGISVTCRKGRKPGQANQDNFFVCSQGTWMLCGVADGHGYDGHWVSHWVVRLALCLLLDELTQTGSLPSDAAIRTIFERTHDTLRQCIAGESFDLSLSGCTLSLCAVDRKTGSTLLAWAGDSRCLAGRPKSVFTGVEVMAATADHKPQDDAERRRIISNGGNVVQLIAGTPHRVFVRGRDSPGLAMSRAVGDLVAHSVGVIHEPGVTRLTLQEGQFLLCCSDGVWEFVDTAQAAGIVGRAGRGGVREATQSLARLSRERWLQEGSVSDDITAIAVWL
eukprot:CAMPEP_0172753438 /NCGR_PEP_ID=MMETSP1074-20121228/155951_1 /TAXON_ID=2916 /ORGANISM="Ceratium fusus, Strain PA161109" /LENGTH=534 /DNA_ID=CAMNT_0013586121 /DNA_START=97 /DNA_END=1701 /DNA_ORIENTATION=+